MFTQASISIRSSGENFHTDKAINFRACPYWVGLSVTRLPTSSELAGSVPYSFREAFRCYPSRISQNDISFPKSNRYIIKSRKLSSINKLTDCHCSPVLGELSAGLRGKKPASPIKLLFATSLLILLTLLSYFTSFAQVTTIPTFPKPEDAVTIIYDASQGTSALKGVSDVYMHAGVVLSSPTGTDWNNVVGNWGKNDGIGKMSPVLREPNKWQITITPRSYFNVAPTQSIYRLAMVFREGGPCGAPGQATCKEGKSSTNQDILVDLYYPQFTLKLSSPVEDIIFINPAASISIQAETSAVANFEVLVDGASVYSKNSSSEISYSLTPTSNAGKVIVKASENGNSVEKSFRFIVRTSSVAKARPAGIKDGINYNPADPSKATLSLLAPYKTSVYVLGDFNNWELKPEFQMWKDGEHFWLEVTGLTSGDEYAFQYLVDEKIRIADPFADKVLDSNDKYIPASIYPNIKPFPAQAMTSDQWQDRVSIIQTGQPSYTWEVQDFKRPQKEKLVIYEILVRDFFAPENRSFAHLIDTLSYLKKLGINAIELMPIMEFNGNDSWGYNPTFMLAVDKAYGTKNSFKKLVDEAHKNGIAIILDIVFNHNDLPSPLVKMYFQNGKPKDNPWLNADATHPFNVFFDFNHESIYTQNFIDSVNRYWVDEYHVDGFRYDLSKGFTQKNNVNDVGNWSKYDASRIAILKRMANKIQTYSPNTYIILEHFAENSEEKELSDAGMMLWGNMQYQYKEAAIGYSDGKSISDAYYKTRGWKNNLLVSYMESHDEERITFDALHYGNQSSSYDIRNINTALDRLKLNAAFYFTFPGPKMIWQFGELGYEESINRCQDGTIKSDCRTSAKPVKWEYYQHPQRLKLYKVYAELLKLRNKYPVFKEGNLNWSPAGKYKRITLEDGNMMVNILGNFDITPASVDPKFPKAGKWYDYFTGDSLEVTNLNKPLNLEAGEFHILTNVKLPLPEADLVSFKLDKEAVTATDPIFEKSIFVFPNPADHQIRIQPIDYTNDKLNVSFYNHLGSKIYSKNVNREGNEYKLSTPNIQEGLYLMLIESGKRKYWTKIHIKH